MIALLAVSPWHACCLSACELCSCELVCAAGQQGEDITEGGSFCCRGVLLGRRGCPGWCLGSHPRRWGQGRSIGTETRQRAKAKTGVFFGGGGTKYRGRAGRGSAGAAAAGDAAARGAPGECWMGNEIGGARRPAGARAAGAGGSAAPRQPGRAARHLREHKQHTFRGSSGRLVLGARRGCCRAQAGGEAPQRARQLTRRRRGREWSPKARPT